MKVKSSNQKRLIDRLDFWRDENGQAMSEFVILAPILLLIMISIVWTYDYQDFHQDAIMEARNGHWTHVVNVDAGGGQRSDGFKIPLLAALGLQVDIKNAVKFGQLFFPDVPSSMGIELGEAWADYNVLNGSIYEAASLPVNNYQLSSGPNFKHESPWNRILFAIGGIFDLVSGVTPTGSWPPPSERTFPNENFPLVSHHWEAINHKNHTWDNSFNLMKDRITGEGQGFTKGLEVSSTLAFPAMANWYYNPMCSGGRSPIYKFNKKNFDFIRDSLGPGLGELAYGLDLGGDPREWISDADKAKNPLKAVSGQNRIKKIVR